VPCGRRTYGQGASVLGSMTCSLFPELWHSSEGWHHLRPIRLPLGLASLDEPQKILVNAVHDDLMLYRSARFGRPQSSNSGDIIAELQICKPQIYTPSPLTDVCTMCTCMLGPAWAFNMYARATSMQEVQSQGIESVYNMCVHFTQPERANAREWQTRLISVSVSRRPPPSRPPSAPPLPLPSAPPCGQSRTP
jgi:hypothetical protein